MKKQYHSNSKQLLSLLLAMPLLSILLIKSASALTYQTSTEVEFTFEPVLTVTTSGNLEISDLTPGAFADSNTITVTVNTNNAYGYNLSATVGDTNNPSSELRHENYATSGDPIFSNLALGANLARTTFSSGTTYDDKWGYSTDGVTYNGLPLYNDNEHNVTLLSSNYMPANGTASTDFLIGAKASATKSSGEYSNVINFVAVANAGPMTLSDAYQVAGKTKYKGYYKMQDMKGSGICENVDVLDQQMQVIDTRDDKVYWIAKLQDGHCWMTQNLDLDLETTPNHVATLTSENTDLNEYGSNGYTSAKGYSCSNATTDCEGGVITWTPANATTEVTYDSEMKGTFPTIGDSSTENKIPKSLNVGDWYYAGYDGATLLSSNFVNYLTSTNRTQSNGVTTVNNGSGVDYYSTAPFTGSGTSNNGEHGHVGNYYNWSASVASNDTSGFTTNTYSGGVSGNPANSICPAGWRLPTTTSQSPTYSEEGSRNEYTRLAKLYASYSGSTSLSSAGLEAAPLFFARGGDVDGSSLYDAGFYAFYWSSSVDSSSYAYNLSFSATFVNPASSYTRYGGYSVRCLAQ